MTLLFRIILLPAALLRAAWLRLRDRPGPEFGNAEHWQGRYRLAVWLAVLMLPAVAQQPQTPTIMCYDMMPPKESLLRPLSRVRVLWMALDPKQGQALASALAASARTGDVEVQVSNLLLRIHEVLAAHRHQTRVQRITCYKMTEAGASLMGHREAALRQLEALTKVRESGRVAPEVLASAEAVLRRELSRLGLEPAPDEKDVREAAHILTNWHAE